MRREERVKRAKETVRDLRSGCSSFAWETGDGKHLWGRNFDFNRIAEGSKVTYIPRGKKFYTFGTELEDNLDLDTCQIVKYASVGVGSLIFPSTPVLYEGMNEKGLMGGQLYYREFACFQTEKEAGKIPVQPPFAVTYFLSQCSTVEEVTARLREAALVGGPLLETVPTIHWMFADRKGETAVIEPDQDGIHIYRDGLGVMTNSPSYPWHRLNLLNYVQIRDLDYGKRELNGESLRQCFSGSGALGLPGDWSSPSRFVRLAYLKNYAVKGRNEEEGVARMFRLFQSAAFPYGMVKVTENGVITEYDKEVTPYDYTVYTSVMCAESLRFYWTTYQGLGVRYADLRTLLRQEEYTQFELGIGTDFRCVTDIRE